MSPLAGDYLLIAGLAARPRGKQVRLARRTISHSQRFWAAEKSGGGSEKIPRPDLRRTGDANKSLRYVLVAIALATAYMYPTIIRPLFGLGEIGELSRVHLGQLSTSYCAC